MKRIYKFIFPCLLLLVILLFLFFSYALNPYAAAKMNRAISNDSELFFQTAIDDDTYVMVFENDDSYQTVIVKKNLFIWKSLDSTFNTKKNSEQMKLISYGAVIIKNGIQLTNVIIQSFDSNAAFIRIGSGADEREKEIELGEIIAFSWQKIITPEDINATIFSKEQVPLYKLDYEIINGSIYQEGLGWIPLE